MIKSYFKQYSGVSRFCWEHLTISFIVSVTRALFFFLGLYFVRDLHLGLSITGVTLAFYGLGSVLGGFVGGKLSDRISFNKVCIVSLLGNAVVLFCLAQAKHAPMLMLLCFLWALFSNAFSTGNNSWILQKTKLLESERLKAFNILFAASNLGSFATSGIVVLSDIYGFRSIFIVSGIVLLCIAVYLMLRHSNYHKASHENAIAAEKTQSSNEHDTNPNAENKTLFWFCVGCLFFVSLIITLNGAVYTLYLNQHFTALKTIGVSAIFAINPAMIFLFQTPFVNLFHAKNKLTMIGVGSVLMGIGMLILPFSTWITCAVISAIIYTVGQMIFTTLCQLVLYQSGKPNKKAQAVGAFKIVYAVSMVVGPAVAGFIYHHLGGNTVWYICGVIGFIALIGCYMMRHHYKM